MNSIRSGQREKAQGMVEFALALPLLLLLIYGIAEAGRLLFLYTAVTTTSRDAARFGAAVGDNELGVPLYRDCQGMRDSAKKIGIFAGIQDSDIQISYDDGVNTATLIGTCPVSGTGPANLKAGTRIVVDVDAVFTPLVPLVPFQGFTIHAQSARTLIKEVPVGTAKAPVIATSTSTSTATATATATETSTPTPTETPTNTPTATFTPTDTPTPTEGPSPTPTATFTPSPTPTNTPTPTLTNTPTITPTPTPVCFGISIYFNEAGGDKVELMIRNNSGHIVRVTDINFQWPSDNNEHKRIDSIKMKGAAGNGEVEVFADSKLSPLIIGESSNTWLPGSESARMVNSASTGSMTFYFNKSYYSGNYNVSVSFDNSCTLNASK